MFINETQDVAKKYMQQRVVKMLENPRAAVLKALKEKAEKEAVRDAELEVRERAETDADGRREDRRREAATMTALDDAEAAAEREEDALRTGDEATNHGGREDGGGEAQSTGAYPNVIMVGKKPHVGGLWIYVHVHGAVMYFSWLFCCLEGRS